MMNPVLEIKNLHKSYGGRHVLKNVSFQVEVGEIFALLGPNGAGKTTTLEIVEGLRAADSGQVLLQGTSIRAGKVSSAIGVQLQVSALPATMTVAESLRFVCAYRHTDVRTELVERLRLTELLRRQYRQLSVGQQRRLQLALAIMHRSPLIILDEPTAGLDVATRSELHKLIAELKHQGSAIVLATHDMAEAEALADRVAIVLEGCVVATGTPRELTRQGDSRSRISVATQGRHLLLDPQMPAAAVDSVDDSYVVYLSSDIAITVNAVLAKVAQTHDTLVDLRVERPSLEQRFLELTNSEVAA